MKKELIPCGYILFSRKILKSGIMEKPPLHLKLWTWMLMKAKFKDTDDLKRGQLFTTIEEMRNAMGYKIGYRKERPTIKQIRGVYEGLSRGTMISIAKVTGGMVITILNYDKYQNPENYEGQTQGHNENPTRGIPSSKDKNVSKNDKNKKILPAFDNAVDPALPPKPEKTPLQDGIDYLLTKKNRKLKGKRFQTFMLFWGAFDYKKGKREAADSWYDIPKLTDSLVGEIVAAAKIEAIGRAGMKSEGHTPKMAQGWLSSSRWEDEVYQAKTQPKKYLEIPN